MSDDLRDAIARAIEPMGFHPSVSKDDPFAIMSRSKAMSNAQAALDAIKAAGWTLEPPEPVYTLEELREFRRKVAEAAYLIGPTDTPFLRSIMHRETD